MRGSKASTIVRKPLTCAIHEPVASRPSIKRDYTELLPLVRHKREPTHPDVQRLLSRDRDVHLTLDAGLQVMAARALRRHAESVGSGGGAAVVLDSSSGELLASASYPWPDDAESADGRRRSVGDRRLSTIARPRAIRALSARIDVQARHRRRGAPRRSGRTAIDVPVRAIARWASWRPRPRRQPPDPRRLRSTTSRMARWICTKRW